jgi:3-methyladenine DNA glycosylase Mpg
MGRNVEDVHKLNGASGFLKAMGIDREEEEIMLINNQINK